MALSPSAGGSVGAGCQDQPMRFEDVAARVAGIPFMSPEHGRRVYDHIRSSGARDVLELGTAHGVSAAYMAAALEAGGEGQLVTVDHGGAAYDPSPEEVLKLPDTTNERTTRPLDTSTISRRDDSAATGCAT